MQIINFGHPLTADVLEAIAESPHLDQRVARVIDVKAQADNDSPFGPQAAALVDSLGWSGSQWQGNPFALVLPGLSALAITIVAEIHGRCGYFPAVIRLKPVAGTTPMRFAFAEFIPLARIREEARARR